MTKANVSIRSCLLFFSDNVYGKRVSYRELIAMAKKIDAAKTTFVDHIPIGSLTTRITLSNIDYDFRFYVDAAAGGVMHGVYQGYHINSTFVGMRGFDAVAEKPITLFANNIRAIVNAACVCTEMDIVRILAQPRWDDVFEQLLERGARMNNTNAPRIIDTTSINTR
jgi:hypothetical protein